MEKNDKYLPRNAINMKYKQPIKKLLVSATYNSYIFFFIHLLLHRYELDNCKNGAMTLCRTTLSITTLCVLVLNLAQYENIAMIIELCWMSFMLLWSVSLCWLAFLIFLLMSFCKMSWRHDNDLFHCTKYSMMTSCQWPNSPNKL